MELKKLNSAIAALSKANAKVADTIQTLGLACLEHADKHGDIMPLNRLYAALRRTQYQSFAEWAMAFGKVKKNLDPKTRETMPLAFDSGKQTDLTGATEKRWEAFGDDKGAATAKAFDFQAAMMALLKKAAKEGIDHEILVKAADVAGIKADKVPATVKTAKAVVADAGQAVV